MKDVVQNNPLLQVVNGTGGATTVPGEDTRTQNVTDDQRKQGLAGVEPGNRTPTWSMKSELQLKTTHNKRVRAHNDFL